MALDFRTFEILKVLQQDCSDGGYKVLAKSDIIGALPPKAVVSVHEFDLIVKFLESKDYVVSKFKDEEDVCLALTPKGLTYSEQGESLVKEKVNFHKTVYAYIAVAAAVGAFVGAFLSTLIASLF